MIWNADFAIQVICSLNRDLRLFRFSRARVRVNHFFNLPRQCGYGFVFLCRHRSMPLRS